MRDSDDLSVQDIGPAGRIGSDSVPGGDGDSLGQRVTAARERAFVGRAEELELFRSALRGDSGIGGVIFVHGSAGMGKSMLLHRFAGDAGVAGRRVVQIDGRTVEATPAAFEAAVGVGAWDDSPVLLIDTFERCQGLETWLRERFVPQLPVGSLVVIAGREPPGVEWSDDPGWKDVLRVVALGGFGLAEARALLSSKGVPAPRQDAIMGFAGGLPLALSLAAAVGGRDDGVQRDWRAGRDVIQTLLRQLVGEVPSGAHQRALQVCARARVTTRSLLSSILGTDGWEMFAWLRGLAFIESTEEGVFPHDAVRQSLEADLRWCDPEEFDRLHRQLHDFFIQRVREAPESGVLAAVADYKFVHRATGLHIEIHAWHGSGRFEECVVTPSDHGDVLRLIRLAEGPASSRIARYWLDRQPEAFRLYRSTSSDEPVACFAWLRCTEPVEESIDPVVAAAWAHTQVVRPLAPGRHLGVGRFGVHPDCYQRPSEVMDLIQCRVMGEILRSSEPSWSFFTYRDDGYWNQYLSAHDFLPIEIRPQIGQYNYALFAHDWYSTPPALWAESLMRRAFASQQSRVDEYFVLSRPEFDSAVREALRNLGHPASLDGHLLHRSRFAGGADLADVLRFGLETVRLQRGGENCYRAVCATYDNGAITQQAAAARLNLPFSTYRRHLVEGVDRLCALLWKHEATGTPFMIHPPQ